MIRLAVLLWPGHAWVLAEESPGVVRRLLGDPWAEDGALPLVVARLGRETHIGTLAECVAYESPRARLQAVLDDQAGVEAVETAARFLHVLDDTVRRRYPQDELAWRFLVAATVAPAALATLSAACWMAGLGGARVARLPAWPARPFDARSTATSLCALFDGATPVAALACARSGATPLVLDTRRDDAVAAEGSIPVTADTARRRMHLAARQRDALCDGADGSRLVALPGRGGWSLEPSDADTIRDGEVRGWQRLACLLAEPAWEGQAGPPAIFEWGQRHWAARLRGSGGHALRQAFGAPVESVALEALAGLFDDAPDILDRTLAFALDAESGAPADHKVVASAGAALPFRSEHLLHLGRVGQQRLAFELHALDDDTSTAYRVAGGELALPAPSRTRAAVQLTLTCHACGALELAFDIPTWHFRETVVVDSAGHVHPQARRCALQLHAGQ